MDTLFVTDLHGRLDVLSKYIELANNEFAIKNVILGGDIAPNVMSLKFLDGEFVLKNRAEYSEEILNKFVEKLRSNQQYNSLEVSGKVPVSYEIKKSYQTYLNDDNIDLLRNTIRFLINFDFLKFKQKEFVINELFPYIKQTQKTRGIQFYCMLGNDDFVELDEIFYNNQNIIYAQNKLVKLGSKEIYGYPYVISKPFRYRYWEKSEDEIHEDLSNIFKNIDTKNIILSIHQPPYASKLDILPNGELSGSKAVRQILEEFEFFIVLTGHNHESYQLSNSFHDLVGKNLVINPGGYHLERNCAIVFDSKNKNHWQLL